MLDAINSMERGNYSEAVRRITTAIEVALEHVMRIQLTKLHPAPQAEVLLGRTRNDFPGRLRQYQRLSARTLEPELGKELDRTRGMRHRIVHRGHRITLADRGAAQRSVDTGRWIFNWIEDDPKKFDLREKTIVRRSLGRYWPIFDADIVPDGVEVYPIPFEALVQLGNASQGEERPSTASDEGCRP